MKYPSRFLSTLFVLSTGMWSLPQLGANAVTLSNGTIAFVQPPRLLSTSTPYTDISIPDTTYYFTIEVPATAGEPLQKVTFNQIQGIEDIEFNQNDTFAFEGTRNRKGTKLALQAVKSKDQQNSFTVTFDSPIPPGKTVTIGLRAYSNPFADGVYLIGVTAFPSGQQTAGQFLGIGRLQFYKDMYTDS